MTRIASNNLLDAEALAASLPLCKAVSAQQVVNDCDLVFVATPDKAITSTVKALRWRVGQGVVHCSGVTEVDALAAARDQGAQVGGFHPMQTFGDPLAAVNSLPGSTVTIEALEPLNSWLVAVSDCLSCRVNRLPPGMRARYHAAAGFTSQFINALFVQAITVWGSWGASEEEALCALMPMARGTLHSIESVGIAKGMPGPVSRGDIATVEKHCAALAAFGPEMLDFYRTLCATTIPLALKSGSIDATTAQLLASVLQTKEAASSPKCNGAANDEVDSC